MEHWRGLLRALGSALHSLLFVRGSWAALKATLVDFAANGNHAIVRSAMHLQLIKPLPPPPQPAAGAGPAAAAAAAAPPPSPLNGGKPGGGKKAAAEPPPWCPSQQMVCREFGLGLASCPSPEAALFIEQAAIAVSRRPLPACWWKGEGRQPGTGVRVLAERPHIAASPATCVTCRRPAHCALRSCVA